MIELLAPAGNLEKLKIAILYGADAVYIGGKKFSLRARASNFDIDDIRAGCAFAKEHQAKIYVTMNIVPHDEDFLGIEEYLLELVDAGVSGIIVSSLAYAKIAKKVAPTLELHLSTQFSASNSATLNYFKELGFSRAVLAREVGLAKIEAISKKTDIELEVFIHGGMCVSYSGRCMLSNHLTNRDANRGGCAHSCRWNYSLYENNTLQHSEDEYFNMGSKDLMSIQAIPKLVDLGVKSLKIEGRMKSIYYIATVVRTYRMIIDEYLATGEIKILDFYQEELVKAENRLTSTGFLFNTPGVKEQLYNVRSETPTKEFVGIVVDYDEVTKIATIEQRNYFEVGDELEFFGPHLNNTKIVVNEMFDESMENLDVARHPLQLIKIKIDFKLTPSDMIRKTN